MKNTLRNTSWIDLLILWIETLPFPSWLFYLLLLILLALINFLAGADLGISSLELVFSAFTMVFVLALNHFIHRVASSSFDQFTPSLDDSITPIEEARRKFIYAPPWIGWLVLLLGISTVLDGLGSQSEIALEGAGVPFIGIAIEMLNLFVVTVLTIYFLANTIRRLMQIVKLHKQVRHVDLFDLESLRSFSRFSSSTSIGLVLIISMNSIFYIASENSFESLIFLVVISLVALAIFLVPLLGLRNTISSARDKKVDGIMAGVDLVANKIMEAVHKDDIDSLGKLKSGMDGLLVQRDELLKVSPWPWNTSTIRGFSSAVLLPIFLWLITRILERFI